MFSHSLIFLVFRIAVLALVLSFVMVRVDCTLQFASKDEILQRNCVFAQGLHPNLIRFVTKEGYHREIEDVVEVTFTNSPLSTLDFKNSECKLALLAKFTKDLYVDPYEIQNIPGLSEDARVLNNWTDLESPSWLALTNSTVFLQLHSNPTGNLITTEQVKLPIHFRYQKPLSYSRFKERLQQGSISNPGLLVNPAGYVKVMVPLPRLLLRCEAWADRQLIEDKCHVIKTLCSSSADKDKDLCEWISLPFKSNSRQGTPVFIPVGDVDSQLLVSVVTVLVVGGGTAFLLHTLLRAKEKLSEALEPQSSSIGADDDDNARDASSSNSNSPNDENVEGKGRGNKVHAD